MVSQAHFNKVMAAIDRARTEGGRVLCGGEAVDRPGWFIAPTVLEGLGPDCATNREEIFGPVVTLQAFDDDNDALTLANASDYGLVASVWTRDLTRAHRVSSQIQAGMVFVNSQNVRDLRQPFGGVKQSGTGREGGEYSFEVITEIKNVCISMGEHHIPRWGV